MTLPKIMRKYALSEANGTHVVATVFPREVLNAVVSAKEVVDSAIETRDRLLSEARIESISVAEKAVKDAQTEFWTECLDALGKLRALQNSFVDAAGTELVSIARSAVETLLIDPPADWPATSSLRLILRDWHSSKSASLHVSPDDYVAISQQLRGDQPIEIAADSRIRPGDCELSCGGMELHTSFKLNVQSLLDALENPRQTTTAERRNENEQSEDAEQIYR